MSKEKEVLRVTIFGTDYPLKVSENVDYIRKVAGYVDAKMKEVYDTKSDRPIHQIAILAALNIADEYFCEKNQRQQDLQKIERKVKQLSDSLELGLQTKTGSQEEESSL